MPIRPCMKSAHIGVAMRTQQPATLSLTRSTCRPRQRAVAVLEERHSTVVELEYLNPSRVVPSLTFSTSSCSFARGKGELSK